MVFRATDYYEEGTTNTYKTFASINRGGSYIPEIVINYTPKLTMTPASAEIMVGETLQLNATLYSDEEDAAISFVSSSNAIATVSPTGVVTGMSSGTAIITASANGAESVTCTVTVLSTTELIQDIQMVSSEIRCKVDGEIHAVRINVSPFAANTRPITWTSSDPTVASVTNDPDSPQNALVTGVSPGCATLTATGDGHSATIIVYVGKFPEFENEVPYLLSFVNNNSFWKRTSSLLHYSSYSGLADESFHWYLTCVDNAATYKNYVISCGYRKGQFLYINSSGQLSWAMLNADRLSAPDAFRWEMTPCGFRNKATGQYLKHDSNGTIVLATSVCVQSKTRYTAVDDFVELTNLSISDLTIPVGGNSWFEIKAKSADNKDATWCDYDDFTYHYSNTSVAQFDSDGRTSALKAGTTTVTITHKVTGVSTTCTVRCVNKVVLEKEDTATQVGELFFTIGNTAKSNYLRAASNDSESVSLASTNDPKKDGRFIWRLKQDADGYYQFISVSNYRTVNGVYSEACLTDSNGACTEEIKPMRPQQQWVIEQVSGGYYIINHSNNQYLTRNGSSIILSSTPSSNSLWAIEGISANQFVSYFEGDITRGWDSDHSMLHVWINVDDSITSGFPGITRDDIRTWATEWDGLGGIISVHTGITAPSYYYEIRVSAVSFDSVDSNYSGTDLDDAAIGIAIPNSNHSLPQAADCAKIDPAVDYTHSHIFLNTDIPDIIEANNVAITIRDCLKLTFLHEMGHTLKLAHPSDMGVYNVRESIMTSQHALLNCAPRITEYDLMNLLCKWKYGGSNNIASINENDLLAANPINTNLDARESAQPILFE